MALHTRETSTYTPFAGEIEYDLAKSRNDGLREVQPIEAPDFDMDLRTVAPLDGELEVRSHTVAEIRVSTAPTETAPMRTDADMGEVSSAPPQLPDAPVPHTRIGADGTADDGSAGGLAAVSVLTARVRVERPDDDPDGGAARGKAFSKHKTMAEDDADPAPSALTSVVDVVATIDQDIVIEQSVAAGVSVTGSDIEVEADILSDIDMVQAARLSISIDQPDVSAPAAPAVLAPMALPTVEPTPASSAIISNKNGPVDIDVDPDSSIVFDQDAHVQVKGYAGRVVVTVEQNQDLDLDQDTAVSLDLDGEGGYRLTIDQDLLIDQDTDIDIDIMEDDGVLYVTVRVEDVTRIDQDTEVDMDDDGAARTSVAIDQDVVLLRDLDVDISVDEDIQERQSVKVIVDVRESLDAVQDVDVAVALDEDNGAMFDIDPDQTVRIDQDITIRVEVAQA